MSFFKRFTDRVCESDLFDFNLKYLYYVGLWPREDWPKYKQILYKIYEFKLHLLSITFIVITGIGTYQQRNNVIMLMTNLDKTLVGYNFVLKIFFFVIKREKLNVLINEIKNSGDKVSDDRKTLMAIHVIFITFISTALVSAFSLLSQYKAEMTVEAWMPFDPFKDRMSLLMAAQILAICFVVPCLYRAFAMQGIVCSIIMYFCDQLLHLQGNLKKLGNTKHNEMQARKEFKYIVKKHVRLMR